MGLQKPSPSFAENLAFLQGLGPDPGADEGSAIVDLTGSAGGGSRAAGAGPPPAESTSTSSAAGPQMATSTGPMAKAGTSGSILDRLYGGLGQQIGETREGLGRAKSSFYAAAGPSRSYESAGAEGALAGAIEPGALPSAVDTARGYVGARYGGPANLSTDETAAMEQAIANLYGTGQALQTGSGLYGLLGQARPEMTPGMRKAEAQALLDNPEYIQRRGEVVPQTDALKSEFDTEQTAAQEYAKQRQQEEASISQKSKDYLLGRRGAIETIGEQAISQKNAERAALEKMYGSFRESGDVSKLPPDVAAKVQGSEHSKQAAAAQAKWDEIMGKYQDIKDIPLLQLNVTGKGRETRVLPEGYAGQVTPEQMARALARQDELSPWFDPGSHRQVVMNSGYEDPAGNYSRYKPLYFNEDENLLDTEVPTWQGPTDYQNYISFDPGTQPTLANQLGADDLTRFNNIQALLGEGGELSRDDAPFRQAAIAVEVDRFLNDQIRMFDEHKGKLTAEQKEYSDDLRKTRKEFRKQRRRAKWGKVGRGVMDFATFGTYELARPLTTGKDEPMAGHKHKGKSDWEVGLGGAGFAET